MDRVSERRRGEREDKRGRKKNKSSVMCDLIAASGRILQRADVSSWYEKVLDSSRRKKKKLHVLRTVEWWVLSLFLKDAHIYFRTRTHTHTHALHLLSWGKRRSQSLAGHQSLLSAPHLQYVQTALAGAKAWWIVGLWRRNPQPRTTPHPHPTSIHPPHNPHSPSLQPLTHFPLCRVLHWSQEPARPRFRPPRSQKCRKKGKLLPLHVCFESFLSFSDF